MTGLLVAVSLVAAVPHLSRALAQGAPSIRVVSPAPGQRVTDADIKVSTQVANYKVQCADVGLPDKPGQGHIHAMLDGMDMAVLTNFYCEPTFTISGLGVKPGKHQLAVILASDTHADVGEPAMVEIDYQPAQAKPLPGPAQASGKPTVKITGPADKVSVGPKFNLQVQTTNINASCDLEGKGNVVGYGHYHVFVDLDMEAMMQNGMMSMAGMISMPCENTIPVDLSAWANGQHTLTVELVNNDHTSIEGTEPAMITVNLQGSPGRGTAQQAAPARLPVSGTGGPLAADTDSRTVALLSGVVALIALLGGLSAILQRRARARG
jgi:hypothetical protein